MTFNKARWSADENSLHLGLEFSKVNKQKRLVSGWATVDNVDTENDLVTAEASADAFARARGNLREMHKKDSAVGRIVSFKQKSFRAPDGQEYNGIFVTARVSEGAEDTWKKVLDGTLNGFSIGGSIVEAQEDFAKDGRTKIRKVTKYDLTELSLVDNPGNQYSDITNVFKIRKSADGSVTALSGMIEEHKVLNVFYCENHEITIETGEDSSECPVDESEKMTNIGYVEDGGDRREKVSTLVTKYISGGGEHMSKIEKSINPEEDETVATGHEEGDPTEVPTPAAPADVDEVEEFEEVEEVPNEEVEISKRIDSLKDDVVEILKNSNKETSEKIENLEKTVKELGDSFEKKASEFEAKLAELDENLDVAKGRLSNFEKSLTTLNSRTAIKKSVDQDDEFTDIEQNNDPWHGSAFSVRDLM